MSPVCPFLQICWQGTRPNEELHIVRALVELPGLKITEVAQAGVNAAAGKERLRSDSPRGCKSPLQIAKGSKLRVEALCYGFKV